MFIPRGPECPATAAVVVVPRAGRETTTDAVVSNIRAELKRFDPDIVVNCTTAEAVVSETLSRQRLGVTLMLIFGATALTLAAIGIYGVIADAPRSAAAKSPHASPWAHPPSRSSG
jgi:hypothetical protein